MLQGIRLPFISLVLAIGFFATPAFALKLVSDESIKEQKSLTKTLSLKNGIKVIYRQIPASDILQVNLKFSSGLKELPVGKKVLNRWMWSAMTLASTEKGYSKEEVFSLVEKYSIQNSCSGGIELSTCSLGTLNDYWNEALPLFAALVKSPKFSDEDLKLTKERLEASLKSAPSDPNSYSNEIVNRIYYPEGHPYRLNHDEALEELAKLGAKDVKAYHKQLVNAGLMTFVVVGSIPEKQLLADLNKHFGAISKGPVTSTKVPMPKFELDNSFSIEDRDIPTAYMRAKVVAPAIGDKDAVASRLMFEILSEELGEEIRTKRSLSYAVYSYVIQYSMGIGVLSATTSKPEETLEAMNDVIQKLKTKTYSQAELDEYKTVFATSYFLTQETHASLASALTTNEHFEGYEALYEFPRLVDKVTPADIKRLANEILVDIRLGVIFDKKKFKKEWATKLIKANLSDKKAGH